MNLLILILSFVSSTALSSFSGAHNCEEIIISEEHHYFKEPLEWNDLKKIGDAPIQGVNKSFICEDSKGQSWYVKLAKEKGLIRGYLISRLMEALTQGTELEGMTVDIRLIKGVPKKMVDENSKTFIASRTLSNFKTGYCTPSAPVKAKGLESLLASILSVADSHKKNLGYLAFEDKWVPIMVDVDWSNILTSKNDHSCPFSIEKVSSEDARKALEMDAETWEYVKHLAELPFKDIKDIIHGAFADIAAVGFEVSSFEETVYKNLHRTHQTIQVLGQLVSNPCVSSTSVEKCTETVASLIRDSQPLYFPSCSQLPQDSRMSSWLAKLLMMHRDLDQTDHVFSGDFFEHFELTPASDISKLFMVYFLFNYGDIQENFIKMLENHTPLANEKQKLYSVNKDILNLSIQRNEWVILKFILEYTDVQSEDMAAALSLAVEQGHVKGVELLIKAGANLDAQNERGDTALIMASEKGHAEIAELLIKAGANLDAQNQRGNTALIMATEKYYISIEELLIKAKANLDAKDKWGYTALSKWLSSWIMRK